MGKISFERLYSVLKSQGKTISELKTSRIIGGQSYTNLRKTGEIKISTLAAICAYLGVQPGEIMEYVPDDQEPTQSL